MAITVGGLQVFIRDDTERFQTSMRAAGTLVSLADARARFPKLKIVQGADAVREAFGACDFLLHGSGPSLVAEKDVAQWSRETGKPYGVFGITFSLRGPTSTGPAAGSAIAATIAITRKSTINTTDEF